MNKKLIVMLVAVATAGITFARPGPGPRGGFHHRGGPGPRMHHGGPHFHHHSAAGWGIAGAVLGTAAIVHDIVRAAEPAPVVVAQPATTVVVAQPATTVYTPAPVVTTPAPVVTYVPPPPPRRVHYHPW